MPESGWNVHKFGGSSLADAACFRRVAAWLADEAADGRVAVVVSAVAGVTDSLIALAAMREPERAAALLAEILDRHRTLVDELFGADSKPAGRLRRDLERDGEDLKALLHAGRIGRGLPPQSRDLLAGYGELWSARILRALLGAGNDGRRWEFLDAREVLRVEEGDTGPYPLWESSREALAANAAAASAEGLVITGFIASTEDGIPTTLRRNGSDFSAAIFSSLLGASELTIWTDVDGVMSADPRRVPEAALIRSLSYSEAMELAYFGARVLHPNTMAPLIEAGIAIRIRNTFRPESGGTVISPDGGAGGLEVVKGFANVEGIALLNLEGNAMIGVPGVAQRFFGALKEAGVSVVMISQASSEHSICVAVPEDHVARAKAAAERAFAHEIRHNQIQSVEVIGRCCVLAAVGDGMVHTPGVASRFFTALARASVNVVAIAQGSSERNISVVIPAGDASRALRAVHSAFFLSEQTLSVGVVGPGLIGRTLLSQFAEQAAKLHEDYRVDLRVRAIAGSRKMHLHDSGEDLAGWEKAYGDSKAATDLERFGRHLREAGFPHAVIIDCTASDEVADHYAEWLREGIHVITPNKKANSGGRDRFERIRRSARGPVGRPAMYYYEATVGAGLPVIATLRDLIRTGDRILRIEGILSGTLSYIFNSLAPGAAFSDVVREAREKGFTEPDPREDLAGTDVARKLVILAREAGARISLEDVDVESLIPAALREKALDVEAFLDALGEHDAEAGERLEQADRDGRVLRYVGVLENGSGRWKARVGLEAYERGHAFSALEGSDNIIAFTTGRYRANPLIVRGPGAGPDVTAGGVFGDLLRLAGHLGAPL